MDELLAGLDEIRRSPVDDGVVELLVRRPADGEREVLNEATLDAELGLEGDNWSTRPSSKTPDRSPHPDAQLTLTNVRAIALLAGDRERWPLAGDQFFVDLNLGYDNLPPGTRLEIGEAVLRVTDKPHIGCRKFTQRFGPNALPFVRSEAGRALNLRGINARVERGGRVAVGDRIRVVRDAGTRNRA